MSQGGYNTGQYCTVNATSILSAAARSVSALWFSVRGVRRQCVCGRWAVGAMAAQRTDWIYEAMSRPRFMTYATEEKGYQLEEAGIFWSMMLVSDQFRKKRNKDGERIIVIPVSEKRIGAVGGGEAPDACFES